MIIAILAILIIILIKSIISSQLLSAENVTPPNNLNNLYKINNLDHIDDIDNAVLLDRIRDDIRHIDGNLVYVELLGVDIGMN